MATLLQDTEFTGPSHARAEGAEAILAAVVFGARAFMHGDGTGTLDAWLEQLGRATGSSQVRLFANDDVAPGEPLSASMRSEWRAPRVSGSPMEALQRVPYGASGCQRWEDLLSRGEPVWGNTRELPESERGIFEHEGDLAVAIVPIFVGARWWGFIGFGDCGRERTWTRAELDALAAAAGIYGVALARQEVEVRIATAKVQEQLATELGQAMTAKARDLDAMLQVCSTRIAHHLGAGLVRVWSLDRAGALLVSNAGASHVVDAMARSEISVGEWGVGKIAERKQTETWADGLPELWPGSHALTTAAGLSAGVGHPLLMDGHVVGVVVMLHRGPTPPAALEGLASVTDELALAIARSRAAAALHLTEDRYQRLVEATVEGICIHDGTRIHDANPALGAMLGYEVAEVIGMGPLDFIHADSLPDVRQRLAASYTGAYETNMVRRDGSVVPVEMKGHFFDHDGVRLRVVSIRDMTERKAAERTTRRLIEEQAARELSERGRRHAQFLADASRILFSSFDTTTTLDQLAHLSVRFLADYCIVTLYGEDAPVHVALVHADPAKQELLESAVAMWDRQPHPDHPLGAREERGKPFVLSGLTARDLDAMAPDPEHRRVLEALGPTSLLSVPIMTGGGVIGAMTFAAGDDRLPYGPEDVALGEELGRRAATALQGARSYHDAQAATAARDEMLAVVAHDLRNPLSAIIMGATMALEFGGERTPLEREQFELIQRSATNMNALIQDLLDATRMESGQLRLELEPTRPADVVAEAMEILLPLAQHGGITLEADVADDLGAVPGDRMRLLQVLSNLVGNALKFTPRGGRVVVSVARHDAGLVFCVADTGPGIAPDQLPHIFGRFWQARGNDRRGLGLGLAIAKGIVDAHGGTIWAESILGEGSSFLFTLPLGTAAPRD